MADKAFETLVVHAGKEFAVPTPGGRPVTVPIDMSVGYAQQSMKALDDVFATGEGYVYVRYGTPTVAAFEHAVAALEAAPEAVAYGSGMAALTGAILGAGAKQGSTVVCAQDVYGATIALLRDVLGTMGVEMVLVDITDHKVVAEALAAPAACTLVCETVSNPLLVVADVPALAEIAHQQGATLIVDSTFATPYLYRPYLDGVDYVVHSATKYISGHGDVMAGVIACNSARATDLRNRQKSLGANLGPMEAWLALRGIRTLALRMKQQCASAARVAAWLDADPRVAHVNYPGLAHHAQHELTARLFAGKGFGAMISFDLRNAGRAEVFALMEALQLVAPVTTLGDVYSLMLYPAMASHRGLPAEQRQAIGIGDGLVRLSIGIEAPEDIIADLDQALDSAQGAE